MTKLQVELIRYNRGGVEIDYIIYQQLIQIEGKLYLMNTFSFESKENE